MAKSLRSKIMRRWRKLKRGQINTLIDKPKLQQISTNLQATLVGIEYRKQEPKNAFLHPDDHTAQFPQYTPPPIIDLRSSAIAGSGLQWSGACRKTPSDNATHVIQMKTMENEECSQQDEQKPKISIQRKYIIKKKRTSRLRKTMVF